ncbi:hypothetical protein BC567DRAFT_226766 [Phyllosticta citribraziliensis]
MTTTLRYFLLLLAAGRLWDLFGGFVKCIFRGCCMFEGGWICTPSFTPSSNVAAIKCSSSPSSPSITSEDSHPHPTLTTATIMKHSRTPPSLSIPAHHHHHKTTTKERSPSAQPPPKAPHKQVPLPPSPARTTQPTSQRSGKNFSHQQSAFW